ncbi:MAG: hypothetical protein LQ351_006340 [Letrouitia transgressa]|nr:MAG: hypothetical protein LQ351_006340 [Letrouitia transgressa]
MDVSIATARSSTEHGQTDNADTISPDEDLSNGAPPPSYQDNKFQSAISAWRNINLTSLVPELDTTASDIVSHQRDALLSRKDLAQKTKDFRKLDDAAKLGEFKGLLKAYQTFIDLITNHGKTTSSAFLQLYSSISEAPDPYPLLEASVDALLLSEDTLPKLTAENEHLQKNITNLTSQLNASEHQLEKEREERRKLEDSQNSTLRDVESSWKAVIEEKQGNWEAKERSLEEKVESQDRLLSELKASYEVSQRLGHAGESDPSSRQISASAAELEIVSSDLDRTSQRLAEVEARNEQLRVELAQLSSNSQRKVDAEEDPVNARLRSENSSLIRKLDAARLEKDTEARKLDNRIRAIEKDAQSLQRDNNEMRQRMHSWRDYPDIKRELEIFKSIEFSTLDDDETEESIEKDDRPDEALDSTQSNGAVKDGKKDTLEQMLLARNKKLGNEMAVLRVSHQDLQQRLDSLQEEMSSTNAELERAQSLNATLEGDLERMQQEASSNFPTSAMSTTGTRGRASPMSSIISGFDPQGNSRSNLELIRAGEPAGGGSGILPMVQAQRDRFKQKNSQLEEEVSKQHGTISSLRQEIASLQKDNLSLYEKSRYVSTYNRGAQASSASSYTQSPQSTSIHVSDDTPSGLSTDRYRSAYEANISPFAAFRGRESARAYRRMSLPERMVFSITRIVLANRTSRNVFAGYCFALHILIFVMLYWMQTVDITRHASSLSQTAGALTAGAGTLGDTPGADAQHGDWHQEGFQVDH